MIDFRYHLVSLMAVLVALTLGVILGAGPLQGRISDTISGELDRLANRQTELQKDRDNLHTQLGNNEDFIASLSGQVIADKLKGIKVAVVTLPNTDDQVVSDLEDSLKAAGASIVSQAALTDHWFAKPDEEARSKAADTVKKNLGDLIKDDTNDQEILGAAVALGLQDNREVNQAVRSILSSGEEPLIEVEIAPKQVAEGMVVIGPQSGNDAAKVTALDAGQQVQTVSGIDRVFVKGTAVVGTSQAAGDLVYELRSAQVGVTTIDSVGTQMAKLNLVLGLVYAIAGQDSSYGSENGASQPVATIPTAAPSPEPSPSAS